MPKALNLLCLPVIEYWGANKKVRLDVNPWKWRLSRNLKHITHGIPKQFRRVDENGDLFSAIGSDGCDYIDANTHDDSCDYSCHNSSNYSFNLYYKYIHILLYKSIEI